MACVNGVRNQTDSQLLILTAVRSMRLARSLRMTICRLRLVGAVAEYWDGIVMYGEGRFDFATHGFGCSL